MEYDVDSSTGFKKVKIDISPLVSEDAQNAASASAPSTSEEISSRKRVSLSSPTDQFPFPSSKRRFISNPTRFSDAATPIPNSPVMYKGSVITIGVQLFTAEIVGSQFFEYIKIILSCLMDDNVSTFGICGLAGVGKTEVAKVLNNYLLKKPNKFHHVIWADGSLDWSTKKATLSPRLRIHKMQTLISNAIGLRLLDADDEKRRAVQLFNALTEKKKCLLILDDVWDYFSLEEVGIPVGVNQCTVGITTRSLKVCREFDCQRRIDIECLPPDESYKLYTKILGNGTTLSEEGEKISRSIVDKCGGLPLAVKTMARNMKGITDPGQLRSAVDGIMRKKALAHIFDQLKLSYDHLQDPTLQHCFLCSLLFVEEGYGTLMRFLVDEGLIKGMTSRQRKWAEASGMLKMLKDACLLEIDDDRTVHMNEVLRSMAFQIMEENQQCAMIIQGSLLPGLENWTEDLVGVSLTYNDEIESIPSNYSPSCPKLSTMLLTGNINLRYIGDSFFEGMPGIRFLCLSDTEIDRVRLSVFGLVNLRTLLLQGCEKLKKIPSIAKLRALKRLDLRGSGVEEIPDDIDMLSELEYLDLSKTPVKELKSGILAKFSYLQVLVLPWSSAVKAEEIACLSRLEVLSCRFTDLVELNKYLMALKGFKEKEPPLKLKVQAGELNIHCPGYTGFYYCLLSDDKNNDLYRDRVYGYFNEDWSVLGLHQCSVNELVDVMSHFQMIVVVNCNETRSFCDFSPIKNAAEFKHFSVRECDGIEFLFQLSLPAIGVFGKLENIGLIK